jgi:hypothetical protein
VTLVYGDDDDRVPTWDITLVYDNEATQLSPLDARTHLLSGETDALQPTPRLLAAVAEFDARKSIVDGWHINGGSSVENLGYVRFGYPPSCNTHQFIVDFFASRGFEVILVPGTAVGPGSSG